LQFKVPKFLERESTIAWGLSFKNLAVMGVLFFVLFGLFYFFKSINLLWLWFLIAILTAVVFVVFNFVRIEGQSAFDLFNSAVAFVFKARLYMWERKEGLAPVRLGKAPEKKEKQKEATLKIAPKSRLGILGSKIDVSSIVNREDLLEELRDDDVKERG